MSEVLFLDLREAFESVRHDILMNKLKYAGLTESTVTWFKSYLTGHHQITKVNRTLSSAEDIKYGVPQRSKLGPLLFIIFVNDLTLSISQGATHLYADDTAIIV